METVIVKDNSVTISENDVKTVQLYANGLRAIEIGKKMKISNRTVEARIETLRLKYSAKTVTHLVAIFMRQGLIK